MSSKQTSVNVKKRKPRLLWANASCLLDTSSGASMSVRQMLHQLSAQGYEIRVLGATVFDDIKGLGEIKKKNVNLDDCLHQLIEINDEPLIHQLLVTQWTTRQYLTTHEESLWRSQYNYLLDSFKPDLVWFYGGRALEMLISYEARARGIPSAAYLVNANYKDPNWCRDVDLIITDTIATSEMYRKSVGFVPKAVGKFIESEKIVEKKIARERLLFVNPSWSKGASVFVQLAEKLERERPDIPLEVVEARANWRDVLRQTTRHLGIERTTLTNVTVTPNTRDMRKPFSRSRVLIAPSLWWESGARVLAESMLNGIPAIVSDSGGNVEMIDDGGIVIDLPEACFLKPYQHLLSEQEIQKIFDTVVEFFDNEDFYQEYVSRALRVGREKHDVRVSTERLINAFRPLINQRAGSKDFIKAQRRLHKHNLAGIAGKPEFRAMPIPVPQKAYESTEITSNRIKEGKSNSNFDWKINSKVVVLDNRAKLIKTGAADTLAHTNGFTILAFDPASEVHNPSVYEGHENIQLFQHALLGDGQPTKLNTCLHPSFSSPLSPLPEEALPEHRQQGAKVLTQLPINTIALDSIEGLPSLDWLILDEFSDAATILAHGEKALKDALLIQARVAFQPTHENQPNLAELQYWASRNGFRFYRFNDMRHHSLLGNDQSDISGNQASELESTDVLFLPTDKRLEHMTENQQRKLAFLLHTVFGAQDASYKVLLYCDKEVAKKYYAYLNDKPKDAQINQKPRHKEISKEEFFSRSVIQDFSKRAAPEEPLKIGEKGVFIDCGGYDGCSAIKFKMRNLGFDCVTFEPNPALWGYYEKLPTRLIKKAAYTYNGVIKFTLDNLDEDGSSLIKNKRIDYTGRVKNAQFPSIQAECVDITEYIDECKQKYDKIILKMDIEGAEYDILDLLIKKDLVKYIDKLYCEFHWHKCGISKKRHEKIVQEVEKTTPVLDWDALDFSIHKRGEKNKVARNILLDYFFQDNEGLSRKGKLVFHIGMHRTGTTTLQEKFFPNFSNYFGRCKKVHGGWGYDECSKKLLKASKSADDNSVRSFIDCVNRKGNSPNGNSLIFSNEALIEPIGWGAAPFTTDGEAPKVKAESPVFDFLKKMEDFYIGKNKAIFVVRKQSDWLASLYSRISGNILSASQGDFEKQVENVIAYNTHWIDWADWLEKLRAILGGENVICLPMEMMSEMSYWERLSDFIGERIPSDIGFKEIKENQFSLGSGFYKIDPLSHEINSQREDQFELKPEIIDFVLSDKRIYESNKKLASMLDMDLSKFGYY
ncbi:FkbM family methyltransferase [Halomonas alkaliantarctica]|nr:FkbM family methyltransferase [Halomonas alkaliantarctica]